MNWKRVTRSNSGFSLDLHSIAQTLFFARRARKEQTVIKAMQITNKQIPRSRYPILVCL